jgi:hypothetical protein
MVRGMWCSAALQRRLMQRKRFSCRELAFEIVSNLRIVRCSNWQPFEVRGAETD